jgi:hypothetical protein
MIGQRTFIRFAILIGLGLGGIVLARNYDRFFAYISTIDLRETFRDDCLAQQCPDAEPKASAVDEEPMPEPKTPTKATVDVKVKKQ